MVDIPIGAEFTGQGAFADVFNNLQRLGEVIAQVQRLGLQEAPTSTAALLSRLNETSLGQFGKLETTLRGLEAANRNMQLVQERIALTARAGGPGPAAASTQATLFETNAETGARTPLATIKGYADLNTLLNQESAAQKRVLTANEAFNTQLKKASDALAQRDEMERYATQLGRILSERQRERVAAEEAAARSARGVQAADEVVRKFLQQRADAEEAAAQEANRLRSVDAELAAGRPTPYAEPDLETHLGVAQARVNQAMAAREIALKNLTAAETDAARTVESVRAAQSAVDSSARSLAAAQSQLRVQEIRDSGSLGQQFALGFRGTNQDRGYVEQIGQAFKFSVLYGSAYKILFGITQGLQFALSEGIAFQESMTELKIASGQSATQMDSLRKVLSADAVAAGAAPSVGVLIGARSLGLFGASAASNATVAQQNRIAETSARVVSRAAFASGLPPEDLQRDIAAIAQAFGQGAAGQARAFDLDAYLSRRLGSGAGSTYAAVAQSATAGQAAGFTQEQITAIAAVLQARTGQDANTVAGYMAQLFSRSGQGSLLSIEQQYGVNQQQSLANQILDLRKIYQANPDERDNISAVFGRGKSQNASIALLQSLPEALKAAADAQTKALGAGDETFKLKLDNVGGQLLQFQGDLKGLASELGRSGMLTALGAVIKIADELVRSATVLLQAWNQLSPVIRDVVGGLLALAAASKIAGASEAFAGGERDIGALLGGRSTYGGLLTRTAATETEAASTTLNTARLAQLGGIVATLSTVVAATQVTSSASALDSAHATIVGDLGQRGTSKTPAQLQAQAAQLNDEADAARTAAHGFFAHVVDLGHASDRDYADAKAATDEARRLQRLAATEQRQAVQGPVQHGLFSTFDASGLDEGIQGIIQNGGTARDVMKALAFSLGSAASAGQRAELAFHPGTFAQSGAASIFSALQGGGQIRAYQDTRFQAFNDLFSKVIRGPLPGVDPLHYGSVTNVVPGDIASAISPAEIARRYRAALAQQNIKSASQLNPDKAGIVAEDIVGTLPFDIEAKHHIVDPAAVTKFYNQQVRAVKQALLRQVADTHDILSGNAKLSSSDLTAALERIGTQTQNDLASLQTSDHSGRIATLLRQVKVIRAAIAATPTGATHQAADQLAAAQRAVSDEQIAQLEDLRRAAQRNATSTKEIAARGRSFFVKEVNNAVRNLNQDALVNLVGIAGKYGKTIAEEAIRQAIRVAKAAEALAQDEANFLSQDLAAVHGGRPTVGGQGDPAALKRIQQLQALFDAVSSTASGNASTDVFQSGSDSNNPLADQSGGAGTKDTGPTAAQIAAARQSAYAAGSQSQIAQARAAMATARADMAAAKKGTVEYYSALGAYLQARNDLTDAIQAYHANLFLLSHDATNPIIQARAAVRAAAAALAADANKPADVRAADRVALQSAQAALEQTRFSQRLEQVQTAEELGRISHRAYINYLDHEHDRLEAIKHRTYQQQQELNQIDQLMKEAADAMQGQWNFGDITLPKPYQVRRYIEQHAGGVTAVGVGAGERGDVNSNNTTIQVDGADTAMVIRVIKDYLGNHVTLQTTKPRKR